ncbi:MAG: hypothetical protein ACRCT8_14335 [Lacipirellulaceae bacterium]
MTRSNLSFFFALGVLAFATGASAQVIFDNGAANTLSAATSAAPLQAVELRDGPGGAVTSLDVVAGAAIGTTGGGTISGAGSELAGSNAVSARVRGSSVLNVSGGARATGDLYATDSSVVTLSVLGFDDALLDMNARLNLLPGGRIDDDIVLLGNAHLQMSGGRMDDEVEIRQNATANISGGLIDDDLVVVDNAVVTISDVTITDDIEASGNSTTTITGGTFGGVGAGGNAVVIVGGGLVRQGLSTAQGGTVKFTGGTLASFDGDEVVAALNGRVEFLGGTATTIDALAQNSGQLRVAGGTTSTLNVRSLAGAVRIDGGVGGVLDVNAELNSRVDIFGGDYASGDLEALSGSVITLFGPSFLVNGQSIGFGVVPFVAGSISGRLADGNDFSYTFRRQFSPVASAGTVRLVFEIPEPTSAILLASGALAARRRRG